MKKILIVDDIEEYLDSLEMILSFKFKVFKARSYNEGVGILDKENIDIAIIDIRLDENDPSNRDGLKLVRYIKENSLKTIPIVMSAYREFDYAVEALNLGAKYFLKKPLNPEEIMEVINKLLKE
ncbi:MAG: response regulator [Candidatus Hydrothermales bacterium]